MSGLTSDMALRQDSYAYILRIIVNILATSDIQTKKFVKSKRKVAFTGSWSSEALRQEEGGN